MVYITVNMESDSYILKSCTVLLLEAALINAAQHPKLKKKVPYHQLHEVIPERCHYDLTTVP